MMKKRQLSIQPDIDGRTQLGNGFLERFNQKEFPRSGLSEHQIQLFAVFCRLFRAVIKNLALED